MNIQLALKVLKELHARGVRDFCVCAGNRNSPLILTLEKTKGLRVFSFVDERSAAFFALGRIHASGGRPAAVIMTSGTAVAECLPAVIEAYYQSLPLIIVSADRPRSFRGSGAPQAIEQHGIFGVYAPVRMDLETLDDVFPFPESELAVPAHINVCIDEPLIDEPIPETFFEEAQQPRRQSQPLVWTQGLDLDRPLILVGSLTPEERPLVEKFLLRMNCPVWLESLSGLRGVDSLKSLALKGGDKVLRKALDSKSVGSVLRLGGVPTTRIWRDLETDFEDLPVFSISHTDFTGLARASRSYNGFHHLEKVAVKPGANWTSVFELDADYSDAAFALIAKYPKSELGLLKSLSHQTAGGLLYLGNSLPIREWDWLGWDHQNQDVLGNRGANGIDGQLSTFLGWTAEARTPAWAVLGDLTTLYDLNAPWVLPQLEKGKRNLVIVNNRGGRIFQKFSQSSAMILPHQLDFSAWAKMWNIPYLALTECSERIDSQDANGLRVIELFPDLEQSRLLNQEMALL